MAGVTRHESRERALGLLYEAEMKHLDPREVLAELSMEPDPYCSLLVRLAGEHQVVSRNTIEATAVNWPLERIGMIDRLVMELALAEASSDDPPPRAVILNEAVELARSYSTDSSGSFVNGILATAIPES
jgi:N utilization substance protein B